MPLELGFKLEDKAIKLFADMKLGTKTTRYFTLKLVKDKGAVCVEDECKKCDTDTEQKTDYDKLISVLTQAEGRFVLLDLKVERKNGSIADQLFFISWNPDTSNIHSKTLYSSARNAVMQALKADEASIVIQANDFDDIDYETLLHKAKR